MTVFSVVMSYKFINISEVLAASIIKTDHGGCQKAAIFILTAVRTSNPTILKSISEMGVATEWNSTYSQ